MPAKAFVDPRCVPLLLLRIPLRASHADGLYARPQAAVQEAEEEGSRRRRCVPLARVLALFGPADACLAALQTSSPSPTSTSTMSSRPSARGGPTRRVRPALARPLGPSSAADASLASDRSCGAGQARARPRRPQEAEVRVFLCPARFAERAAERADSSSRAGTTPPRSSRTSARRRRRSSARASRT